MPFDIPQLSPPFNTPVRFTEFHWPGGLRVWMAVEPTNDLQPLNYPGPPYYDRLIVGSGDMGQNWTEVTRDPFTIEPIDAGIDNVWDALYCGGDKVVARAIDNTPGSSEFLRLESNDRGVSWAMAAESTTLVISESSNEYLDNSQYVMTYTGDGGEIFTMRPAYRTTDGNMLRANVYKSTDYGVTWTNISIVNGWNVRGICYIGKGTTKGPNYDKKRFVCIADRALDGTFNPDEDNTEHYSYVYRSNDGGLTWGPTQLLSTHYNAAHGQSSNGWWNKSHFAYLGEGEIVLLTDMRASSDITVDAVVYKSTDYGSTWTEVARLPKSPYLIPWLGDPVPEQQATDQHCIGIWYLGKRPVPGTHPDNPPEYKTYLYAIVVTTFVRSLAANAYNIHDQWVSEDGGATWTWLFTLPNKFDAGSPGQADPQQIWWPDTAFFVGDNEAIPGLYD